MKRLFLICILALASLVSFGQSFFKVPANSHSNITNSTQLSIEFRIWQDSKLVNSGVLQPGEKSYCPSYRRYDPFQSPILIQFKSNDPILDLDTGTSNHFYIDHGWWSLMLNAKTFENCSWDIVIIHGIVISLPTKIKIPKA